MNMIIKRTQFKFYLVMIPGKYIMLRGIDVDSITIIYHYKLTVLLIIACAKLNRY